MAGNGERTDFGSRAAGGHTEVLRVIVGHQSVIDGDIPAAVVVLDLGDEDIALRLVAVGSVVDVCNGQDGDPGGDWCAVGVEVILRRVRKRVSRFAVTVGMVLGRRLGRYPNQAVFACDLVEVTELCLLWLSECGGGAISAPMTTVASIATRALRADLHLTVAPHQGPATVRVGPVHG